MREEVDNLPDISASWLRLQRDVRTLSPSAWVETRMRLM
jgi:hypothetical protein